MRVHPVLSIFLGVIVCFILWNIGVHGFGVTPWVGAVLVFAKYSWFGTYLIIVSYILGGFIATYFAKERDMRYGLFEGICIIFILTLLTLPTTDYATIFATITILFLAILGGMLGQITDKNYSEFNPILAVIAGFVIAINLTGLLSLITGSIPNTLTFGVINVIIGFISLMIGAFVTILLVKEKKIQYGIYIGIFFIIIANLDTYFYHITLNVSYYEHITAFIGITAGYFSLQLLGVIREY